MAYRDDIIALGADHLFVFDNDTLDEIGSVVATGSGTSFTTSVIAQDCTNALLVNALTDRVAIASTSDINNSSQRRKVVAGFFMTSAFQAPPTMIYGEGIETTNFQILMGNGNNIMFEVTEVGNFPDALQVYGPSLQPNRVYHLCAIFLGNTMGNEIKFFVDGVSMLQADPIDRQPDEVDLNIRGAGVFGDPSGTVGAGGTVVIFQAARDGTYNHWCTWGDKAEADLTDDDVRITLFERGVLAEETITTDTEANMQIALDALTTAQPDAACCVEIEAVSGGGDFTLVSDLTFDALASIHFKYNGTSGTLTIVNSSGGDATIGSAPFGGSIVIANRQTISVTALDATTKLPIENARAQIVADSGGDLAADTVIMSTLTNASGVATATFDYTNDQPIIGRVRYATGGPYYKTGSISGPLTSVALASTVFLIPDGT